VPRTSSVGLTNAVLPYLQDLTTRGIQDALQTSPGLAVGVCTYNGSCTNEAIARIFDLKPKKLSLLLGSNLQTLRN